MTAGEMVVPKVIGIFIDQVLPEKNLNMFWGLLGSLTLVLGFVTLLKAWANLLEKEISEKAARDLQFTVFQKFRKLGFPYYEKHSVGESLSLMNTEVTALTGLYRDYLPPLLKHLFIVIVIFLFLVTINVQLVLLVIPILIIYYFIGPIMEKKTIHATIENTEDRITLNEKYYESMSALTELRAHHRTSWDLTRMQHLLDRYNKSWGKVEIFAWLRGVPRRLIVYGGAAALYIYGIHLVQVGTLTVGEFVTFALYFTILTFDITFIMTMLIEVKIIMVQARRLYGVIEMKPEVQEHAQSNLVHQVNGKLEFQNVDFSYENTGKVVSNFTLTIYQGEKVALVGESGSGKTTILKLIGRFYDPTDGVVLLDDISLKSLSFQQLRTSVGFVFQETYLFGTSIKENIRFGQPSATDEEIILAAKSAQAHDFIMKLPNGYDTEVGERGYKLSGGQRQRIAIARMFIKDPKIIVLDEATSALDNVSERKVKRALDQLLVGRTTIAVAHRLSTIEDYDRIVVMDRGEIVEVGCYEHLMERKGYFYQLSKGVRQIG